MKGYCRILELAGAEQVDFVDVMGCFNARGRRFGKSVRGRLLVRNLLVTGTL
jgi:hypothetical protein